MTLHDTIRKYLTTHGAQSRDYPFSGDDSLLEGGVIDSVVMVELIAFLEREFAIQVDEDDMTPENFDSVNAIVEFVGQQLDK